ncbi:MAG: ExbD/TolR family protein, partial [Pseudohongiellaceae bacterium]
MKSFAKAKDDGEAGEIDLTPMLDVVFILLIFFIVTSVFVKEAGYDVDRPVASTAEQIEVEPILIAISPAGEVWMDGDVVLQRNLRLRIEQRLAETPNAGVVIQADQASTNQYVLEIM